MKRPALYSFIYFAAGIAAVACLKGKGLMLFAFLAVIINVYLYFKIKSLSVFILSFIFGAGIITMGSCAYKEQSFDKSGSLKGYVYDTSYNSNGGQTVTLKDMAFVTDNKETVIDGRGIIYTPEGVFVRRGDYIGITYSNYKNEKENYVSGFDYNQYILLNNIVFTANADNVYLLGHKGSISQRLFELSEYIGRIFDSIYPRDESSVLKAVILGDGSYLSDETRELYTSAGIAHILSVSGLHTAVISIMILRALKMMRINSRKAAVITIFAISFYAVFAGGKASIVRSAIMVNVYLLSKVIYREADTLNSMGIAGLALLAFNPYSLFSVGFQLSFISVTAILAFNNICEFKQDTVLSRIKEMVCISLFVNICTLPILAYNFYEVPVYGFITNVFVVPLLGVLTALGFASAVAGVFSTALGIFLGGIVYLILNFISLVCGIITRIPFSVIITGRPSIVFVVLFYCVLLSFIVLKDSRKSRAISVLLTAACVFSVISNRLIFKYNTVEFMPSDYGGGAVIRTYNGKVFLIGQRNKGGFGNEAENAVEYINLLGRKTADALFIDGTDKSDINFAIDFINDGGTDVIYIPKGTAENKESLETLLFAAYNTGTEIKYISAPCFADFENNFNMYCVFPNENMIDGIMCENAIFKFKSGDYVFFYLGGAEETELKYLMYAGYDILSDAVYSESLENDSIKDFITESKAKYIITENNEAVDFDVIDTENYGKITFKTNGTEFFIKH